MNSSTSSSNRIFPKIAVLTLAVMAAATGLVRLFTATTGIDIGGVMARVGEARAALPRMVQEERGLVMFYGSSMVQAGFSPRQFDAGMETRGVEIKSFNFGFGGLNPLFQKYLAYRIEDRFEAENRQLELALIEFNPFQATLTRRNRAAAIEETLIAALASKGEMWDMFLEDPDRGTRLLNIRYLRGSVSAEMITHGLGQKILGQSRPAVGFTEDEAVARRRRELMVELNKRFEEEYPDYEESDWSYEWQGGGTIPEERRPETLALVDEYYTTLQTRYRMESARLRRIQRADILELNFDEELIASFIDLVHTFQRFSKNVEVVLLPRNTRWIQPTPEAMARMRAVMERIEAETGVPVRDYQDLAVIDPSMFRDATHLNRYQGAVAFTDFLVETYAPLLE